MTVCKIGSRTITHAGLALLIGAALSACAIVGGNPPSASPTTEEHDSSSDTTESASPETGSSTSPTGSPSTPTQTEESPKPEANWADTVDLTRSGVAHLLVTTCEGTGFGSGFLIDDDLVVTAAHVVDDAAEISLRLDAQLVGGLVLGTNNLADIALVRTVRDVEGHQFGFIQGEPRIGTEVSALGFPLSRTVKASDESRNGFSANFGAVTGMNQVVDYGFGPIENMIRTDTSINSGNSGGPLVNIDGEVVGLASGVRRSFEGEIVQGWGHAVTAPRIVDAVDEWKTRGSMVTMESCENAPAPDGTVVHLEIESSHDQATNIAQSLVAHGQAINNGNYDSAFEIFSASMQKEVDGLSTWERGLSSSYWTALKLRDVENGGDKVVATVELWTQQDPEDGWDEQACSIWQIEYTMAWDGVRWVMEDAKRLVDPEDCTPGPPDYEPDPDGDGGAGEIGD